MNRISSIYEPYIKLIRTVYQAYTNRISGLYEPYISQSTFSDKTQAYVMVTHDGR